MCHIERQRLTGLDASKISEPQPAFFHSTLNGTDAHVKLMCHRFEAAPVAD
jgi:hypothetical protein